MTDTFLKADEREKNTRCTTTCMEPGCSNLIRYDTDDIERFLYCEIHRTESGRHSATKQMKSNTVPPVEKKVIFRCPIDKSRTTTSYTAFLTGEEPDCLLCGRKMLYHKEA
jgi:hypothetical protein